MELEHFLTWCTKVNSKCIKELSVRPDIIRLLEENLDRASSDIYSSKIFFDSLSRKVKIKTNEA